MAKKIKTGRKKIPDSEKTVLVGFYTKRTVIEKLGGIAETRQMAKRYVEGSGVLVDHNIKITQ